jgi:hypothetical protein
MTLSIMTLNIMTLSIISCHVSLMPSVEKKPFMPMVVMLNVVKLNVVMQSVEAPWTILSNV